MYFHSWSLLFFFVFCIGLVFSQDKYDVLKEEWCGEDNCYDLLGLTILATSREIKTKYNNISLTQHPDKNPNATDAEKRKYLRITHAYEILSNANTRDKYDNYLKIKASMDSPRENTLLVSIVLFIIISFIVSQYQIQKYNTIRTGILQNVNVKRRINELYGVDFSQKKTKKSKPKSNKKNKKKDDNEDNDEDNLSKITDEQINNVLSELNLIVPGWHGSKPGWLYGAQSILKTTIWSVEKLLFYIRWHIQYTIRKQSYTQSDREYLCQRSFKITDEEWNVLTQEDKNKYLNRPGPWKKIKKDKTSTPNSPKLSDHKNRENNENNNENNENNDNSNSDNITTKKEQ